MADEEQSDSPENAPAKGGPRDTASILAAARKTAKPGPVSKSAGEAKAAPAKKAKLTVPPMPEKPAYARPQAAATQADDETRREAVGRP